MNNEETSKLLIDMHGKLSELHGTMKAHVENGNIHQLPPCSHMKRVEKGILAMLAGTGYLLLQKIGIV